MAPDGPIEKMTQAPGEYRDIDGRAARAAQELLDACGGDVKRAVTLLMALADA